MDGVILIEQAREVGLELSLVDGALRMKGVKRLAGLVKLISDNKQSVIEVLTTVSDTALAAPAGASFQHSTTVDVTETPANPVNHRGFVDNAKTTGEVGQDYQPPSDTHPSHFVRGQKLGRGPRVVNGATT